MFDPRTNDFDPPGLSFTIIGISLPQFGSATFTPTSITYTAPATHIAQTDVFSYTIQNSAGLVSSAFVTVAEISPTRMAASFRWEAGDIAPAATRQDDRSVCRIDHVA